MAAIREEHKHNQADLFSEHNDRGNNSFIFPCGQRTTWSIIH